MDGKKAQIGSTLTWAVAIVVIIVVLVLFLVVSNFMFKTQRLIRIHGQEGSESGQDFLAVKSLGAYLKTEENSREIYGILQEQDIGDAEGNLAKEIFYLTLKQDYFYVWFGIANKEGGVYPNKYFPGKIPGFGWQAGPDIWVQEYRVPNSRYYLTPNRYASIFYEREAR